MIRIPPLSRYSHPWLLAILLMLALPASAGGSPETTLLVVNADSPHSLAVANEYIRLRRLPERQVLWLQDVPVGEIIGIGAFRRHILEPIRAYLALEGLDEEIDLIAYSAGFPYGVDFTEDLKREGVERNKRVGTVASLTGLTFFQHRVLAMDLGYLSPRANQYFRPWRRDAEGRGMGFEASRGFRSRHAWRHGQPRPDHSSYDRYYLSVLLGYTGERGNSLPEIRDYLGRAAAADGTQPEGTVYLMSNPDIRSRVRQPLFPLLMEEMRVRGRAVEILTQKKRDKSDRVPRNRDDVIGLVAGTRLFDWENSGSRMLPGAIAESFTSYGGHFSHHAQTKLTEFLRHGAAGSSGAVQEPYSFMEKFPVPQLHRYYADGCSLAEAFYQSVASPYQLIIVGDPLARPFAHFGKPELMDPDPGQPWHGLVRIEAAAAMPSGDALDRLELWIDGLLVAQAKGDEPLWLDTRRLLDGAHELRLVAVAAGSVETRSWRSWPIQVRHHDLNLSLQVDRDAVPYGEIIQVSGEAKGALTVHLYQGRRLLASAPVVDGRWQAGVASALLGEGEIRLRAEARHAGELRVRSTPVRVRVGPPETSPGETGRARVPLPAGWGVGDP